MIKQFLDYAFHTLWYDDISDSTLKRSDWRFHHNGISILIMFVCMYINLFVPEPISKLFIANIIISMFSVYKLFVQGKIANKTWKDIKDFIADLTDYSIIYLIVVYPNKILTLEVFVILFVAYFITSILKWSTP